MDADRAAAKLNEPAPAVERRPRGIRNANPLNLRPGAVKWYGEIEPDPDGYCRFGLAHYGIRAGAKNLLGYQRRYGLQTIREFITRWAPPADHNDTDAYVAAVARECGIGPDAPVTLYGVDPLARIVAAIIRHENGQQPYSAAEIEAACMEAAA